MGGLGSKGRAAGSPEPQLPGDSMVSSVQTAQQCARKGALAHGPPVCCPHLCQAQSPVPTGQTVPEGQLAMG